MSNACETAIIWKSSLKYECKLQFHRHHPYFRKDQLRKVKYSLHIVHYDSFKISKNLTTKTILHSTPCCNKIGVITRVKSVGILVVIFLWVTFVIVMLMYVTQCTMWRLYMSFVSPRGCESSANGIWKSQFAVFRALLTCQEKNSRCF